jgi:hypothetical protein
MVNEKPFRARIEVVVGFTTEELSARFFRTGVFFFLRLGTSRILEEVVGLLDQEPEKVLSIQTVKRSEILESPLLELRHPKKHVLIAHSFARRRHVDLCTHEAQ